jgi:hypothetical protein
MIARKDRPGGLSRKFYLSCKKGEKSVAAAGHGCLPRVFRRQ